jgi:hypothetical protein
MAGRRFCKEMASISFDPFQTGCEKRGKQKKVYTNFTVSVSIH